mmetsp:Transcript_23103/g.45458  ORF Transcript_23103/g.45458 Transcript_23103/m.45458 type:complete len:90 (-) Transcript_23103:2015-2284(-)
MKKQINAGGPLMKLHDLTAWERRRKERKRYTHKEVHGRRKEEMRNENKHGHGGAKEGRKPGLARVNPESAVSFAVLPEACIDVLTQQHN